MAKNVTATQLGAAPQVLSDISTVQEIMEKFNLSSASIKVNGVTQEPTYALSDYDFVSFGEKVKGGL